MTRSCKCQICGKKGTTNTLFQVNENGKNKYYCNQEEYEVFMKERFKREELIKYIAVQVFEYEDGQIVSPVLLKKIKELNSFYDYEVIHDCFIINRDNIQYWIKTKNFTSEYNMICYIMKIIEGNINDVYSKWKYKKRQQEKMEKKVNIPTFEEVSVAYVKQKEGDSILGFLDEEDL